MQRRIDYNQTEEQTKKIKPEEILEEYATDVRRMRPLVGSALRAAEIYCKNYLAEKDNLAYLAYFRRKVKYSLRHITESNANLDDSERHENVLNE